MRLIKGLTKAWETLRTNARRPALGAMLAAAALQAGTALVAPSDALAQGGTVKVVMHSGLRNLDPVLVNSHITRNHAYLIYDVLIAQDDHFRPQPQMASWQISADGLTYTFTLRDGLKFHDGAPVTAADAVASLQRWGSKDTGGKMLFSQTASLEAKGDKTVVWTLKRPFPALPNILSKMSTIPAFIMPARIARTPASEAITQHIGSGPFRFVDAEFQPGVKSVYQKFQDYAPRSEAPSWLAGGKVAKVDRVEWITMPDSLTAINALVAGEIDYIEMPPADLLPIMANNPAIVVEKRDTIGYQFIARMNFKIPPFDNVKIRQAALKALGQEELLKIAIGDPDYYKPCGAIFGCNSPYASTIGAETLVGGGDPKGAKKLLDEAGYDGKPIVVFKASDIPVLAAPNDAGVQALRRAGFKVDVKELDFQTRTIRLTSMKPVAEGGWNMFFSSFHVVDIDSPVYSNLLDARGDQGYLGWPDDPKLEAMRRDFAEAPTPDARKEVAARIQAHVMENVTYVPLGNWFNPQARSSKLTGMIPGPVTVFWNLQKAR
ncbi:ABC transporter substrate-binding protein [Vineibacter terrae]|uniref:ABC transporter substrate-binding protein n=1 Tax=Vineibacter terrae TaxID=2586908 RepID=UPI002E3200BC|nr:ABC transporter substrate-binding protein [Vineibacter terrae]HEX2888341.1 ABC transporter substrate-binding protein [Vineibacter terrae]